VTKPISFALLFSIFPLVAFAQSGGPTSQYGHQLGWKYELADADVAANAGFEPGWKVEVGEGRSQIVVADDQVFVFAGQSEKRKGKPPLVKTRLLCLDRATGNEIWKHESDPQPRLLQLAQKVDSIAWRLPMAARFGNRPALRSATRHPRLQLSMA